MLRHEGFLHKILGEKPHVRYVHHARLISCSAPLTQQPSGQANAHHRHWKGLWNGTARRYMDMARTLCKLQHCNAERKLLTRESLWKRFDERRKRKTVYIDGIACIGRAQGVFAIQLQSLCIDYFPFFRSFHFFTWPILLCYPLVTIICTGIFKKAKVATTSHLACLMKPVLIRIR